jgi:hypothetical protein
MLASFSIKQLLGVSKQNDCALLPKSKNTNRKTIERKTKDLSQTPGRDCAKRLVSSGISTLPTMQAYCSHTKLD